MKAIIIDNDIQAVSLIRQYASGEKKIEILGSFTEGLGALNFVKRHKVDMAIIDIGVDGLGTGKRLREVCPEIVLVYTAESEEFSIAATHFHAAAYLVKPYTSEELDYSVQTAVLLSRRKRHSIFVKTFGYFDVFVDDCPIMFRSGKAKELLALLVDRQGGTVNTEQIICTLWEDRPNDESTQNLCCKTTKALKKELREHGIEELLVMNRSMKRVNTDFFTCDLYELLKENELARKKFVGEYMLEYSWAEERMAGLSKYL